jgi:HK97 family phage portal protein
VATSFGALLARTASRLLTILPAKEDFPGTSPYLWNQPWAESPWMLDFPKAAAMVPTVYACTSRIAQDVAAIPVKFYRGRGEKRTEIEREDRRVKIADLWADANPEQSGYELERDRMLSLLVSGNTYLYLERFGQSGPPTELWVIPGHLMAPVPGPHRGTRAYEYHAGGRIDRFDAESVIHFRLHNPAWNPLEPPMTGLSPLEAVRLSYESRFNMMKWQQKFYERGGQTNLVLKTPQKVSASDPDIKRWQDKLDQRFSGLTNAFKPMIISGLDVVRAGITPQEMQFIEQAGLNDADICRVYQVPPIYIGVKEGGGLSDAGASTDAILYVEGALKPACALRDAVLNERFCPLFGEGISCESDLSGLLAVQGARLDQAKALKELAGRPIYTVNEARKSIGDEDSDDETADDLVVPTTMMKAEDLNAPDPVPQPPSGTAEAPPGAPPPQPMPRPQASQSAGGGVHLSRALLGRRRDRDRQKYERRIAAWARSYFSAQERMALSSLDDQKPSDVVSLAYSVDDMMDPDGAAMAAAQRLFEQLILERGADAAAEVGLDIGLRVTSGWMADLIRSQSMKLVTGIDETTREMLRRALADATSEQASFGDVVGAVRNVFDLRKGAAMTIARTETTWAYNVASMAAWNEAGIERKRWLTIGDEAVRDSHVMAEADGAIPLNERFSNGLLYPGEPGGDAAETINCRCVIEADFEPAPSETGLARVFERNGKNRLAHLFNGVTK